MKNCKYDASNKVETLMLKGCHFWHTLYMYKHHFKQEI